MLLETHHNPVFSRLAHGARCPSARATLWLAAGLGLVSLALTVFLMVYGGETHPNGSIVTILQVAGWGLLVTMPLVVAPVAAILTAREARDDAFQLLRLTPSYTPKAAVRGLVFAALYRLRVPLVLTLALSPFVMVQSYRSDQRLVRAGCYAFVSAEEMVEMSYYVALSTEDLECVEPSDIRLLAKSLVILLWPVGLWGAVLFSAAMSVWLTLWWGRSGWVWAYIVGVPLCVIVVLTLLGPTIGSVMTIGYYPATVRVWPPPELEAAAVFSLVFYALAWGVMRLARRWA